MSFSSFIDPVIVMCVSFVWLLFGGGSSLASNAVKLSVGVCFLGNVGLGSGESSCSLAKNGSNKSSFADNLSETFAKHFPTNLWASKSWIL